MVTVVRLSLLLALFFIGTANAQITATFTILSDDINVPTTNTGCNCDPTGATPCAGTNATWQEAGTTFTIALNTTQPVMCGYFMFGQPWFYVEPGRTLPVSSVSPLPGALGGIEVNPGAVPQAQSALVNYGGIYSAPEKAITFPRGIAPKSTIMWTTITQGARCDNAVAHCATAYGAVTVLDRPPPTNGRKCLMPSPADPDKRVWCESDVRWDLFPPSGGADPAKSALIAGSSAQKGFTGGRPWGTLTFASPHPWFFGQATGGESGIRGYTPGEAIAGPSRPMDATVGRLRGLHLMDSIISTLGDEPIGAGTDRRRAVMALLQWSVNIWGAAKPKFAPTMQELANPKFHSPTGGTCWNGGAQQMLGVYPALLYLAAATDDVDVKAYLSTIPKTVGNTMKFACFQETSQLLWSDNANGALWGDSINTTNVLNFGDEYIRDCTAAKAQPGGNDCVLAFGADKRRPIDWWVAYVARQIHGRTCNASNCGDGHTWQTYDSAGYVDGQVLQPGAGYWGQTMPEYVSIGMAMKAWPRLATVANMGSKNTFFSAASRAAESNAGGSYTGFGIRIWSPAYAGKPDQCKRMPTTVTTSNCPWPVTAATLTASGTCPGFGTTWGLASNGLDCIKTGSAPTGRPTQLWANNTNNSLTNATPDIVERLVEDFGPYTQP